MCWPQAVDAWTNFNYFLQQFSLGHVVKVATRAKQTHARTHTHASSLSSLSPSFRGGSADNLFNEIIKLNKMCRQNATAKQLVVAVVAILFCLFVIVLLVVLLVVVVAVVMLVVVVLVVRPHET